MAKKRKKRAKKRKKSGSIFGSFFKYFIFSLLIVIAGVFVYHRLYRKGPEVIKTTRRSVQSRKNIKIFIASGNGLKVVNRSIKKGSLKSEISETFTILLWADSGAAIPRGTRLLGVEIKDKTAILDINETISKKHRGGTSAEMQTIYSIVNSITLNYPAIREVKILVEGKTQKTLAGHIDISVPLGPYRALIKDS